MHSFKEPFFPWLHLQSSFRRGLCGKVEERKVYCLFRIRSNFNIIRANLPPGQIAGTVDGYCRSGSRTNPHCSQYPQSGPQGKTHHASLEWRAEVHNVLYYRSRRGIATLNASHLIYKLTQLGHLCCRTWTAVLSRNAPHQRSSLDLIDISRFQKVSQRLKQMPPM